MSQSWKGCSWQLGLASSLAISGAMISQATNCAFAQSVIIPDHTLGNESSRVERNRLSRFTEVLNGGAIRGKNLFHSFLEFNVNEGYGAFFLSPNSNIQNIVVRVTGSNVSKIMGILGAFQMSDGKIMTSNANLFLINPNGIIFGPNARVNLDGGSFVASTASGIKFTDGTLFSASAPKTTPLLKISVPLGLQFGPAPGDIIVQGGLAVQPGKTLALVGGNVTLNGGTLKAGSYPQDNQIGLGGQIALGGILGVGTIGLNLDSNSQPLSFPNGVQPADVSLSNKSQVSVSGEGGGSIQVQGRRVTLTDGSQVFAQTLGNLNGRRISIQAEQRTIKDGSQVTSFTSGAGFGGNLTVTASDSVQVLGIATDADDQPSGLFARTFGKGMAGNLTINTRKLIVQDGANISTSAQIGSQGPGGTLNVTASDFVKVSGTSAINGRPSILSTQTLGTGDAGSLTIDTNSLIVQDGGQVTTSTGTGSQGNGGTLTVRANGGSVEFSGTGLNDKTTGLFARTRGSGDAGSLAINTGQLTVRDGAQVTVESLGTGTAGNLAVNARSIRLDNDAKLSANTQSTKVVPNREQATININSQDLIMRRGSKIITNATGENVIGGNINIDTDVLAAVEKSIISANSADARGGRVIINTQGLFRSPDSSITATGANPQLNGTVQINTPDVDPSRGLVPLKIDVVDVARLVDDNICARTAKSSFTYTGRGGLPPSPNNTLNSDVVWEDWQLTTVPRGTQEKGHRNRGGENNSSRPTQIVEAQGWIINQNGEVELIAYAPTATPHFVGSSSSGCQPPIAK